MHFCIHYIKPSQGEWQYLAVWGGNHYICVYYTMATKKVPQRRNKNAGKSTGKSKSAKYFAANPDKRAAKNAYNSKYHSSTERKKKEVVRLITRRKSK